jgi:Sulfotransferase domain
MVMNVIGVGFGRTGTASLKAALERLGFGPCAHFFPLIEDQERAALWLRAAQGEPECVAEALAGHRSTVDWPGTYFWRDLIARYPEAKVVLTVRDPQKWYASAERTIYRSATSFRESGAPMPPFARMAQATVWNGTFKSNFADRDFAIRTFEEHNEAVRREVPAERLLEFEVRQGWGPLCDFLGRPVPDEDFPRLNDTQTFQEHRPGLPD